MTEDDLLKMLSAETDRRAPTIIKGVKKLGKSSERDPESIEEIRVEAHGLKGAAMVVGQKRLAKLGEQVEIALVQRIGPGTVDAELAAKVVAAIEAFQAGAQAAAAGEDEPASVGESLSALS
jgi:HPt (histidine-containing phosphotransfer) domain-containing protein